MPPSTELKIMKRQLSIVVSTKFAFSITPREQAGRNVDQLQAAGVANNDLSGPFPDKGPSRDVAHEMNTKAPEGAIVV